MRSVPESLYDPELIHKWVSQTRTRPESETVFVAPGTSVEQKIAEIYSELLGIEEIGIHDSFFDLGGHSLLAMQVLSRINHAFQVELEPTLLFMSHFTVAELAEAVLKEQVRQVAPQDVDAMLQKLSEAHRRGGRKPSWILNLPNLGGMVRDRSLNPSRGRTAIESCLYLFGIGR